jgi:hypothetical protein
MAKSQQPVSASAPKNASSGSGKLESVTLQPTDNGGVIVRESRRGKPAKGDNYPSYMPDTTMAFGDVASAVAYAHKCLSGGGSEKAEEAAEKY